MGQSYTSNLWAREVKKKEKGLAKKGASGESRSAKRLRYEMGAPSE